MSRLSKAKKFRLGFALRLGSKGKTAAFYTCCSCHSTLEAPIAKALAPEAIALWARRRGWDAHANYAAKTRCPDCKSARHNKIDSSTMFECRRMHVQ